MINVGGLNAYDKYASINEDGSLAYLSNPRLSPLIGVPSIQDRLFHYKLLSRLWTKWYPEGPAIEYIVTALTFLSQPDVIGVWYGDTSFNEGITIPAMTKVTALEMLDDFIRVGNSK